MIPPFLFTKFLCVCVCKAKMCSALKPMDQKFISADINDTSTAIYVDDAISIAIGKCRGLTPIFHDDMKFHLDSKCLGWVYT